METSSQRAEAGARPVKPGCDTNDTGSKHVHETGLKAMNSQAKVVALSPVTGAVESQSPVPADGPAAEKSPAAGALEQHEALASDPPTESSLAALDTRLIPTRPVTPFAAAASVELIEGGDEERSTAPDNDIVMVKEQLEACTSCSRLEESQTESSNVAISSADHLEEQQSWSRLLTLISQKLNTLKHLQEQHHTLISTRDGGIDRRELVPSGSVCAVERTHKSVIALRRTVSAAGPRSAESAYEAVRGLLLCLDSVTDFVSAPRAAGEEDRELKLLQQECVLNDLASLWELLLKTEAELLREGADAVHCGTCLQDCLAPRSCSSPRPTARNTTVSQRGSSQGFSFNQLCILESSQVQSLPQVQSSASWADI
ncbi:uncharacterized protein LOC114850135 [Betta splendens]|uniref:Uncharacterized protein LOC114850135 n=1 Tax=Betta splendens TaxID=158456 RepID=A0A9W2XJK1_BETSP|nr:uncharacterized protein LOC114850135 [Betta splendens]